MKNFVLRLMLVLVSVTALATTPNYENHFKDVTTSDSELSVSFELQELTAIALYRNDYNGQGFDIQKSGDYRYDAGSTAKRHAQAVCLTQGSVRKTNSTEVWYDYGNHTESRTISRNPVHRGRITRDAFISKGIYRALSRNIDRTQGNYHRNQEQSTRMGKASNLDRRYMACAICK